MSMYVQTLDGVIPFEQFKETQVVEEVPLKPVVSDKPKLVPEQVSQAGDTDNG